MFDWREVYVQQERHKEFLLEAQQYRMARKVASGRETQDHVYRRALTWLGHHLVAWGCFLEERYSPPVEAPAVPAANRCR
jgi:hypothetical protein